MIRKNDEYDKIYLLDGDFGFAYTYKNHYLGNEKIVHPDDIIKIGASKCNGDKIFIECGKCHTYMNYIHSLNNSFSGKWMCPECSTYVRETTVNRYVSELPDIMDTDYDNIY